MDTTVDMSGLPLGSSWTMDVSPTWMQSKSSSNAQLSTMDARRGDNEDNPSPKKPRRGDNDHSQKQGSNAGDMDSGFSNRRQGKQQAYEGAEMQENLSRNVDEIPQEEKVPNHGNNKGHKEAEGGNSSEESEDKGLRFLDLVSPGGKHLKFGTWQEEEIRQVWRLHLRDNISVAINEYGTNLGRNKYDPLEITEAKAALASGKFQSVFSEIFKQDQVEKPKSYTIQHEVEHMQVQQNMSEAAVSPSPPTGTQEAPGVEWSTQEDNVEIDTITCNITIQTHEQEGMEAQEGVDGGEVVAEIADMVVSESQEDNWIQVGKSPSAVTESEREAGDNKGNGGLRQSSRVRQQGLGGMKIGDKAELAAKKKNLEGKWPIKYLGVPVAGSKLHVMDWLVVDEKLIKRLEGWKGSCLSLGGLHKEADKQMLEEGAEAMKATALGVSAARGWRRSDRRRSTAMKIAQPLVLLLV